MLGRIIDRVKLYILTRSIDYHKYVMDKTLVRRLTLHQLKVFATVARLSGLDIKQHSFVENPIVAIAPFGHPLAAKRSLTH